MREARRQNPAVRRCSVAFVSVLLCLLVPLVSDEPSTPTVPQIFSAALRLGCTSFGGPVAHLAFFRRDYVERRGWVSERDYADLVALCQFLPGPASSQTGFGLGYLWRGWMGGLAAWLGFTLPSAVLMTVFALSAEQLSTWLGSGWLHGLKLAAVAVVAHAVIAMWRSLAPDVNRSLIVVASTALLLLVPWSILQLVVLIGGAVAGLLITGRGAEVLDTPVMIARPALGPLLLFGLLLVALPVLQRLAGGPFVTIAGHCFEAGSLVFGGGHIVLPWLQQAFVGQGGLTLDDLLAGYGAAQAMPGPLFTFATFIGGTLHGVAGAAWATVWIFAPGLLLVAAVLPAWRTMRHSPHLQAALGGANAAVVGLLLTALLGPVGRVALGGIGDFMLVVSAWATLQLTRLPAWAVVLACAALSGLLA